MYDRIDRKYCDNIDRLNKYKQQITNNLQLYSCARSQHAHAIRVNWLNIITISYCYYSKNYSGRLLLKYIDGEWLCRKIDYSACPFKFSTANLTYFKIFNVQKWFVTYYHRYSG